MPQPASAARSLEWKIVRHCAPTLSKVKPANMFSCRIRGPECGDCGGCTALAPSELLVAYADCRARLESCGVRMCMLAQRTTNVLILVYRPELLARAVLFGRAARYLADTGYDVSSLTGALRTLARRVELSDCASEASGACSFPHEVGLFLGYPFDDVMGFIDNAGAGCKAVGCWKVYADEGDAAACFCSYDQCKRRLCRKYEEGMRLEQLAS